MILFSLVLVVFILDVMHNVMRYHAFFPHAKDSHLLYLLGILMVLSTVSRHYRLHISLRSITILGNAPCSFASTFDNS